MDEDLRAVVEGFFIEIHDLYEEANDIDYDFIDEEGNVVKTLSSSLISASMV